MELNFSAHEKRLNSHGDVKYSTGNIDSNIAVTVDGAEWVLKVAGEHFVRYLII